MIRRLLLLFFFGLFAGPSHAQDLRRFILPGEGTAHVVALELESTGERRYRRTARSGDILTVEIYDDALQLVEHTRMRLDDEGVFATSHTTYRVDSAGDAMPLFGEIESGEVFTWDFPRDRRLRFAWFEPRRLDARTAGIRVERERLRIPGVDTVDLDGEPVPAVLCNDLVRLWFLDAEGGSLGEDFFLDFTVFAEGLGPVGRTRQYADGGTVKWRFAGVLDAAAWERLTGERASDGTD